MARNTKGVRLINLSDSDAIVSKVTIVEKEEAKMNEAMLTILASAK